VKLIVQRIHRYAAGAVLNNSVSPPLGLARHARTFFISSVEVSSIPAARHVHSRTRALMWASHAIVATGNSIMGRSATAHLTVTLSTVLAVKVILRIQTILPTAVAMIVPVMGSSQQMLLYVQATEFAWEMANVYALRDGQAPTVQ